MLSPSDAAVVARDPELPGLAVLLDTAAVSTLVGAAVRRDYLRYKPGTSCVLGGRVDLPDGSADLIVTAYGADSAIKLDKTVSDSPRGSVLYVDRAQGVVAALASADRDLPFLAALAHERTRRRALRRLLPSWTGRSSVRISTLSYKPMRRWVGLLTAPDASPVVLRAYRPADAERSAAGVRELMHAVPRTPQLLGIDPQLGVLALTYLEGRPLDALLAEGRAGAGELEMVGRALAQLHGRGPTLLPNRTAADDLAAVQTAAEHIAVLLPELAAQAHELATDLCRRLVRLPVARSVVHGDFSADQVVVDAAGHVALLDLDRTGTGDPATDLASLWTSATTGSVSEDGSAIRQAMTSDLYSGYAQVRPLPPEESVRTHAAALLLRRVVEPFRLCRPDWPDRARRLLSAAAAAVPGPLESAPDDLVTPLLGAPLSWELLKHKPGRRRTSRANGPYGTAIVKVYASARAPVVAARVRALGDGPAEPILPRVLLCDEARHVVVLSEVPGRPFREALLVKDVRAAARVGRALAGWHAAHRGRVPAALRAHTAAREVEILLGRCATAPPAVADRVRRAAPSLQGEWPVDTVVHRDLYEEQIVLHDSVGLLDLDDAAAGPAELDLGNLSAHLELLARRTGVDLDVSLDALLDAYCSYAPLDTGLLDRCRTLSLLRLACLHSDPALVPDGTRDESTLTAGSSAAQGRATR